MLVSSTLLAATCEVFCRGPLLETVQLRNVFPNDSKHFVDCPLLVEPEVALARFAALGPPADISDADLSTFVAAHFGDPGSDLETVVPADFRADPAFAERLADAATREWALAVHVLWRELGRRVLPSVRHEQQQVQQQHQHNSSQFSLKGYAAPNNNASQTPMQKVVVTTSPLISGSLHGSASKAIKSHQSDFDAY